MQKVSLQVGDKLFESITAAQEHYAVRDCTYRRRKSRGWTTEQSLGISCPPEAEYKAVNEWFKDQKIPTRVCRDCRKIFSLSEENFYKAGKPHCRTGYQKWHHSCKSCIREDAKWRSRLARFNLTKDAWHSLFDAQGNKCAVCGTGSPGANKSWHTDHDHTTGLVRGILCRTCNLGLGFLGDTVELLKSAVSYLEGNVDEKETTT